MMDTPQRSFVKAALWTALGLLVMTGIGFVFTGSVSTGGAMAVINSALGLAMYVIYERIWARISWGLHARD